MVSSERGRLYGALRVRLSPRMRQALQSLALSALIAVLVVAAVELSRWHPRSSQGVARAGPQPGSSSGAPAPSARPRGAGPSLAHDERLVPVAPEAAQPEAPPKNSGSAQLAADSASAPKFKSASELFADANQARTHGDARTAIALSQLIEANFPNSPEGITTHLSLGVLYLQQKQPELALQELKIYRHIGSSEVMAEALWGEEQALQQLGRTSEERAVLEELLQSYPHSVYAAAAEQRLAALNN
jgi:TolA-binding protein